MSNYSINCTSIEEIDETSTEYIITQVFGWATGILALVKVFFLTITILIKKYTKNISIAFVIIGIIGAICAIIFGVRINEISIYVRGVIMLVLSLIIMVAKIVFNIEYNKKISEEKKEIEIKDLSNNEKLIIEQLEEYLNGVLNVSDIKYTTVDIEINVTKECIKINEVEIVNSKENIESLLSFLKMKIISDKL
jgi:uncharacterized protein with PQ loop repeat